MKKYYYYSFAFLKTNNNYTKTASVYIGYNQKSVSKPQIESAKKEAGIDPDAVMVSCCYLGKMTEEEMQSGKEY